MLNLNLNDNEIDLPSSESNGGEISKKIFGD